MIEPIHPYRHTNGTPHLVRVVAFLAGMLAIVTGAIYAVSLGEVIAFSRAGAGSDVALPEHFNAMVTLAAIWAIGPPIWFWWEYYRIYLRLPKEQRGSFEGLKYGQQLATAVWASLLVMQGLVLSALF